MAGQPGYGLHGSDLGFCFRGGERFGGRRAAGIYAGLSVYNSICGAFAGVLQEACEGHEERPCLRRFFWDLGGF